VIVPALLIAQAPLCGGFYGITPETSIHNTGCFVHSGRGDGSGAVIRMAPQLSPSPYQAEPVPPATAPSWLSPFPGYPPYPGQPNL